MVNFKTSLLTMTNAQISSKIIEWGLLNLWGVLLEERKLLSYVG